MTKPKKTHELEQKITQLAHELYGAKKLFQVDLNHRNQITLTIEEKNTTHQSKHILSVKESNAFLSEFTQCQDFNEKAELFYHFLSYSGATRMKDWTFTPLHPLVIPGTLIEYAKEELKNRENQINERHYQKIQAHFENYSGSQRFLIQTWDQSLRKLIKKAPLFKDLIPTLRLSEEKRFDCLILTSPTYRVVLKEDTSRNQLHFEPNLELIQRLFQIEELLASYLPHLEQIEQLLTWIQEQQQLRCQHLVSLPNYEQVSPFYSGVEAFKTLSTPGINYKQLRLAFRSGPSYALDELSMSELQTLLSKELDAICQTIENQLQLKQEEMSTLQCNPVWRPILSVIYDSPKKGLKTYIEILRGSTSSKIKSNAYDQLKGYNQLCHLSSLAIEQQIEEGIQQQWIKRQSFKASFGRYDGLILTPLGEKILKANLSASSPEELSPQPLHSFSDFLQRLQSGELMERLIPLLSELSSLAPEEIPSLIEFILTKRPLYRQQETVFIESIAKLFPVSHQALLDLNIVLTSGVVQKTFKQLKNLLQT